MVFLRRVSEERSTDSLLSVHEESGSSCGGTEDFSVTSGSSTSSEGASKKKAYAASAAYTLLATTVLVPLGALLYKTGRSIKEWALSKKKSSSVSRIRRMQNTEERRKLAVVQHLFKEYKENTLGTVALGFEGVLREAHGMTQKMIAGVCESLRDPKVREQKCERHLFRERARCGHTTVSEEEKRDVHALAKALQANWDEMERCFANYDADVLQRLGLDLMAPEEIAVFCSAVRRECIPEAEQEQAFLDFEEVFSRFILAIAQGESQDPLEANRRILLCYRAVLQTHVYQMLKENPTVSKSGRLLPAMAFLGDFAHVLHAGIHSSDTFCTLGQGLLKSTSAEGKEKKGKDLADALRHSHREVKKQHYGAEHKLHTLSWIVMHPMRARSSFASHGEWGRAFGKIAFDPIQSHNHSSVQGAATSKYGTVELTAYNCYGGTPTIDDAIAPEFKALLQHMENGQFASDPDPSKPCVYHYTNLQEIGSKLEDGRVQAIMALNMEFPLSFQGITLGKNTEFYMQKEKRKAVMKGDEDACSWEGAEKFAREVREELLGEKSCSFRLRGREEGDSGCYFPGDKRVWEEVIEAAIGDAQSYFKDHRRTIPEKANGRAAADLRAAFLSYVYIQIEVLAEQHLMTEKSKDLGRAVSSLTRRACKDNIDRGGDENTKYAFLLLDSEGFDASTWRGLMAGYFHGRALAVTDRAILGKHTHGALATMEYIEPEEFRERTEALLEKRLGVTGFHYALESPSTPSSPSIPEELR